MHHPPFSNSAKHAVAMVEQHEVSTVEQLTKLKTLSNVLYYMIATKLRILLLYLHRTGTHKWLHEFVRVMRFTLEIYPEYCLTPCVIYHQMDFETSLKF